MYPTGDSSTLLGRNSVTAQWRVGVHIVKAQNTLGGVWRVAAISSPLYFTVLLCFMSACAQLLIDWFNCTLEVILLIVGAFVWLVRCPKDRCCSCYQMCPKVQSQGTSVSRPSRVGVKKRYQKWQMNKARTDVLLQQLWLLPSCWQVSIKNNCSGLALFSFSCYTACVSFWEVTLYPCRGCRGYKMRAWRGLINIHYISNYFGHWSTVGQLFSLTYY